MAQHLDLNKLRDALKEVRKYGSDTAANPDRKIVVGSDGKLIVGKEAASQREASQVSTEHPFALRDCQ